MAKVSNIMEEPEFKKWYAERPAKIQAMIDELPPDRLYQLSRNGKPNGRGVIGGYSMDGTYSLILDGTYYYVDFARMVKDIGREDLVECELPGPDEEVGVQYTKKKDIQACIDRLVAEKGRCGDPMCACGGNAFPGKHGVN